MKIGYFKYIEKKYVIKTVAVKDSFNNYNN